jgi:hypothetical protein
MSSRSVAFLVGVDTFSDSAFKPLRFCQNDVDGMARVLRNPEISGFEVIEVRNKRHDEVLKGLERTVAKLVAGDKLLFYFAGHGRRSPQSGRLYLVAADTESDAPLSTGILIDRVLDIIQESRCDNRALVLDCCYSGAVGERFRARGGDIATGFVALKNAGTYILTASTAIELAEERESAAGDGTSGNGIFTKYLIEALETGDASSGDSDEITIDAVYDYVQKRITSQQPQRFVIGGMGRFVIGRSVAGYWERRRGALLSQFQKWLVENIISHQQYVVAAAVFNVSWPTLNADQQGIGRRALDVLNGKLSVIEIRSDLDAAAARLAEEERQLKAEVEALRQRLEREREGEERRKKEEDRRREAEVGFAVAIGATSTTDGSSVLAQQKKTLKPLNELKLLVFKVAVSMQELTYLPGRVNGIWSLPPAAFD